MTSYTKALYRRDPAAANEFHRQQSFEQRSAYGKVGPLGLKPSLPVVGFGTRTPSGVVACEKRCQHPGCAQGCTLIGWNQHD